MHSFNVDFSELASVMSLSWREIARGPAGKLLRSALEESGALLGLCPAVYEDGRLVMLGADLPSRVHADGETRNFLLDSFIPMDLATGAKGSQSKDIVRKRLKDELRQHIGRDQSRRSSFTRTQGRWIPVCRRLL
jgi:hypothetical protein